MSKIALIAAAGRGSRMLSLTENNPKAMLPFQCKPIIGHHLDYLIEEGFKEVVIVVGYKKEKLIDYVNAFYKSKINVRFAEQTELNGLAGAVDRGIDVLTKDEKENNSLLILLGDIILKQKIQHYTYDFIGYNIVDDWSRWCLIKMDQDGEILEFIDKPDEKPDTNCNIVGVYHITNVNLFEESLNEVFKEDKKIRNEFQISQAFEKYINKGVTIDGKFIRDYYDLGELDALNKTRKNIARHFNTLTITEDNTIIKTSENKDKIIAEADWYLSIPNKLTLYTPHLVGYDDSSYELEFIHSNPIQELYLFNLPENHQWANIFKNIKKYLDKCKVEDIDTLIDDNYEMLVYKTLDRVEDLDGTEFIKSEFVVINNIVYKNPVYYIDKLIDIVVNNFCNESSENYFRYLHGDLFFGNMLYDVNTNSLKIIDPRGSYGELSIYGDIRYDIAKLNHSVNGYYDFIVNGLYFLEEVDGKYFYHFYESRQSDVKKLFDEIILCDFNKKEIRLLTGLLFLTMIPLHSENPKNQKMQFIKAVEYLNEFL